MASGLAYYTDNVYVDYVDGGYFLYNPFHPGIRVVIYRDLPFDFGKS